MFHKATDLKFLDGTLLEVSFRDGKVIHCDMSALFSKYPKLEKLKDRALFLSGKLMGSYGIVWNDDLDIETETIYEEGELIRIDRPSISLEVGDVVMAARARKGITQKELSDITGIDQSDISKIERGVSNPSVSTLSRIADALDSKLVIMMEDIM